MGWIFLAIVNFIAFVFIFFTGPITRAMIALLLSILCILLFYRWKNRNNINKIDNFNGKDYTDGHGLNKENTKDKSKNAYSESLKDYRWKQKRLKILERDNYTCQMCGKDYHNDTTHLNVHHKYYYKYSDGTRPNPWEYCDNALVTLCDDCHSKIHKLNRPKVYTREKEKNLDTGTENS